MSISSDLLIIKYEKFLFHICIKTIGNVNNSRIIWGFSYEIMDDILFIIKCLIVFGLFSSKKVYLHFRPLSLMKTKRKK